MKLEEKVIEKIRDLLAELPKAGKTGKLGSITSKLESVLMQRKVLEKSVEDAEISGGETEPANDDADVMIDSPPHDNASGEAEGAEIKFNRITPLKSVKPINSMKEVNSVKEVKALLTSS